MFLILVDRNPGSCNWLLGFLAILPLLVRVH